MMNTKCDTVKPSRVDLDRVDVSVIADVVAGGNLSRLSPQEREYFSLMDLVRGLRARLRFGNGKVVTRAAIIKILQTQYGLKMTQSYRLYNDAINFFYHDTGVTTEAFRNLYAERLEKAASAAEALGDLELFHKMIMSAAKLRGCFERQEKPIPDELITPSQTIIYTTRREDLGLPAIDRAELRRLIEEEIPEIPEQARERVKMDAGLAKFDLRQRLLNDINEFSQQ